MNVRATSSGLRGPGKSRTLRFVSVALVGLLAACSGAPGTSTSASPTSAASSAAGAPSTAASGNGTAQLPPPELTHIRIGNSALDRGNMTYRFAMDQHIYEKYGITVEASEFDGSGKLLPALIGGQVDLGINTPSSVIASLATDQPLIMTGLFYNKTIDGIYSASDIKSADDLRGKRIAVSQYGTESHAEVVLGLKDLGLTTDDVTIVQIGGQQDRIAALKAGSVVAAPIDTALDDQMKEMGFNLLVNLEDAKLPFPRSGLQFTREFVQKNPNTVLALTAALLDAQNQMPKEVDKAVDTYMAWAQETDRAVAQQLVEQQLELFNRDLCWSKEGWDLLKEVQVKANPDLANVDVTQGYTFDYLHKLHDMGFDDQIGLTSSSC
jgi:NitT/TauT family transport system substrate-binding protein